MMHMENIQGFLASSLKHTVAPQRMKIPSMLVFNISIMCTDSWKKYGHLRIKEIYQWYERKVNSCQLPMNEFKS